MIHLTTKIHPAWYTCLDDLRMDPCLLPRDVSTRWNSTFDMLETALKYCKAIDSISSEHDLELQPYELNPTEWKIVEQLCDILKVSAHLLHCSHLCN